MTVGVGSQKGALRSLLGAVFMRTSASTHGPFYTKGFEMKYLHRDNFRHLTGFGRDMADYVDFVIGQEAQFLNANIQILYDAETNMVSHQVQPYGNAEDEGITIGGHAAHSHMMLSIMVKHHGIGEATAVPVMMIIKDAPDFSGTYQMYQHYFTSDESGQPIENACYTGITKRGWRTRWAEHLRSANAGSHYLFHKAIRQWNGKAQFSMHVVIGCGLSEHGALKAEEEIVEKETLYPLGLNMVPGGTAGIAYLRRIGAIGQTERVSPDDRQSAVDRFFERTSRKGLSNPLAAANWLNSEYAEKVICAGPDRLKPQQIRDARYFASLGQDASQIAERVGARNTTQVQRLISGETYSRIA